MCEEGQLWGWKFLKHEIHSMAPKMYFMLQLKACTVRCYSIRVSQSCTTQLHIIPFPMARNCADGATLCGKV